MHVLRTKVQEVNLCFFPFFKSVNLLTALQQTNKKSCVCLFFSTSLIKLTFKLDLFPLLCCFYRKQSSSQDQTEHLEILDRIFSTQWHSDNIYPIIGISWLPPSYTHTHRHPPNHPTTLQHSMLFVWKSEITFLSKKQKQEPRPSAKFGLYDRSVFFFFPSVYDTSVCVFLLNLYLKLECFTYLCMSFYNLIIIALDFVSQQCSSILSLHPTCFCCVLVIERSYFKWMLGDRKPFTVQYVCLTDCLARARCYNAVEIKSLHVEFEVDE